MNLLWCVFTAGILLDLLDEPRSAPVSSSSPLIVFLHEHYCLLDLDEERIELRVQTRRTTATSPKTLLDVGRIRIGARLIADCTSQPLAHQVEGLRSFRLSDVGDDVGLEQFTDLVGAVGVEVLDPLHGAPP